MISFEINGILYKNVIEASFQESMVEFTNEASFRIALDGTEDAPFIVGSECTVFVDNTQVMFGYIYDVNLSYDSESHVLEYIIRDKTADLGDSDLDKMSDLSGSLSLTNIIKKVIEHLNTDIEVINEFDNLKNFNLDIDGISPEFAQNAFDYIENLARKRQVLISTNEFGQIIIYRNSGNVVKGKIQNSIKDGDKNNVLNCSFSLSHSGLYNRYVVRSDAGIKPSKSPFGSGIKNKEVVNQVGVFINSEVRVGRQRCLLAEESSVNDINIDRAKWQNQFASVESTAYSVELQGHSINGEIFKSNTLMQVVDDFARIEDNLLIKSVGYSFDINNGSTTSIELVDKDSFRVLSEAQEEETFKDSKKNIFEGL